MQEPMRARPRECTDRLLGAVRDGEPVRLFQFPPRQPDHRLVVDVLEMFDVHVEGFLEAEPVECPQTHERVRER
jgi:hypothetical protein